MEIRTVKHLTSVCTQTLCYNMFCIIMWNVINKVNKVITLYYDSKNYTAHQLLAIKFRVFTMWFGFILFMEISRKKVINLN